MRHALAPVIAVLFLVVFIHGLVETATGHSPFHGILATVSGPNLPTVNYPH